MLYYLIVTLNLIYEVLMSQQFKTLMNYQNEMEHIVGKVFEARINRFCQKRIREIYDYCNTVRETASPKNIMIIDQIEGMIFDVML